MMFHPIVEEWFRRSLGSPPTQNMHGRNFSGRQGCRFRHRPGPVKLWRPSCFAIRLDVSGAGWHARRPYRRRVRFTAESTEQRYSEKSRTSPAEIAALASEKIAHAPIRVALRTGVAPAADRPKWHAGLPHSRYNSGIVFNPPHFRQRTNRSRHNPHTHPGRDPRRGR
jgi:hypothetical protein